MFSFTLAFIVLFFMSQFFFCSPGFHFHFAHLCGCIWSKWFILLVACLSRCVFFCDHNPYTMVWMKKISVACVCASFFHCFLTRYFPFFLIVVGNRHNNHIIYEHTYALFSLFAGFSVCLCSHSERDLRESEAEKEVQSVNIQAFPSRQMITKAFTFFRYKLPNPVNITLHNVVTAAAAREYRSERCVSECS